MLVTQFAKDEVEAAGLVKFDFLGLKTLTVIDDALGLVNRRTARTARTSRAADIPLDDPPVYELISRGDTAGVFQMESSRLHRDGDEDEALAASRTSSPPARSTAPARSTEARGRPDMVDVYIDRKHGREKVALPAPAPGAGAQGRPTASSSTRSR